MLQTEVSFIVTKSLFVSRLLTKWNYYNINCEDAQSLLSQKEIPNMFVIFYEGKPFLFRKPTEQRHREVNTNLILSALSIERNMNFL